MAGCPLLRWSKLRTWTPPISLCSLAQDWTIVRPGGLKSDAPTGQAILTEDRMASGSVDRADVAEMIIKV